MPSQEATMCSTYMRTHVSRFVKCVCAVDLLTQMPEHMVLAPKISNDAISMKTVEIYSSNQKTKCI